MATIKRSKSNPPVKKAKSKVVKLNKKPAAKIAKSSTKKPVKKVIQIKKSVAKTVSRPTKKSAPKKANKTSFFQRILTAEGWRRMMMKNRKAAK